MYFCAKITYQEMDLVIQEK